MTQKKHTQGPGPWCGTSGGYGNHGCRCTPCTDANTREMRSDRARRFAGRVLVAGVWIHPGAMHGTTGGYQNWGCRCWNCTEANRESRKWYRSNPKKVKVND